MLSADAFSAFEEVGLDDEEGVARVGRRFRSTILALGGGRAPDLVFKVHCYSACLLSERLIPVRGMQEIRKV